MPAARIMARRAVRKRHWPRSTLPLPDRMPILKRMRKTCEYYSVLKGSVN